MLALRLPGALCVVAVVLGFAAAATAAAADLQGTTEFVFKQYPDGTVKRYAIVTFDGPGAVRGEVTFVQVAEGPVLMFGNISGLSPGRHGFHVHEKGDVSTGCAAAGGHFNPEGKSHGGPEDSERHVGDLGNIVAGANGVAMVRGEDRVISLMGPHSILDRAVVVHSQADDLGKGGYPDSLTTGHAGDRVACATIRIKFPGGDWPDTTPSSAPSWRWSWALLLPTLAALLV